MKIKCHVTALFAGMLAASAWAQSVLPPPNLNLPPASAPKENVTAAPAQSIKVNPVTAASTAAATSSPEPKPAQTQPGVYYDDPDSMDENSEASGASKCKDSTYNQAQIHGALGMGVVGGNHISGNYETGVVNVSKALGSCDHPTGGVSISVGLSQGNFNGGPNWRH